MVFTYWQKSESRTSEWRRWQNERVLKVTGKKMIFRIKNFLNLHKVMQTKGLKNYYLLTNSIGDP
jgi:hypothetical protein